MCDSTFSWKDFSGGKWEINSFLYVVTGEVGAFLFKSGISSFETDTFINKMKYQ